MDRVIIVEFTYSEKVINFLIKKFNFDKDDKVFKFSHWYENPTNKEFPPDEKYFDLLKVGDLVFPEHDKFLEEVISRVIDSGGLDCDDFWNTNFKISRLDSDGNEYEREILIRWGLTSSRINRFGTITKIKNIINLSGEDELTTVIEVSMGMDGE